MAASEFFATAILLLVGCAGCYSGQTKTVAPVITSSASFGFAVTIAASIFGGISGAHMNPCVTVVHVILGGMHWLDALMYVTAQTLGAIAGYGMLKVVIPGDVRVAVEAAVPYGAVCGTIPVPELSSLQAVLAELTVTSMLLLLVSVSIVTPGGIDAAPFKFGALVGGLCVVEAAYTATSMNPVRSLAPALWAGAWERFWVYPASHAIATVIVPVVFRLLLM